MLITLPFLLKGYQRSFRNTIDFTTIRRSQLKDKLFKKPSLISWVIWKRIDKTGQMTWSQFFIKIVGESFGNSVLDNSNWDKISHSLTKKKKSIFQTECNSFWDEKKILLSKPWYISGIYTIQKFIKEEI